MKYNEIKLNNYQIGLILFGVLIIIGHIINYYLVSEFLLNYLVWSIILITGLIVNYFLVKAERKNFSLITIVWGLLFISGFLISIKRDSSFLKIQENALWFIIGAIGMLASAIIYNNITYIFLFTDYLVSFLVFQFFLEGNTYILAGVVFLVLILIDVFLEYSFLRRKITNFAPSKDYKPTKFKEIIEFENKLK